jgi:hypothetical protein
MKPSAFGFYIRGEKAEQDAYSYDAKRQLYAGLMLIQARLEMRNLCGIYIDVDSIDNMKRPAYLQMKQDLVIGCFKRIFTLNESALLGTPAAEIDLHETYDAAGGFDLFVCLDGDCVQVELPWLR